MSTSEPYCIVFGVFLGIARTMPLPERLLPWAEQNGWMILARDSDIPNADLTGWHLHSNPRRHADEGEA